MKLLVTALWLLVIPQWVLAQDTNVKINQIQVYGTHNSYKKHMSSFLKWVITSVCSLQVINLADYEHPTLTEQLNLGSRSFEIDIWADRNGGKFNNFRALSLLGENGQSGEPELLEPGFKVIHDPTIDFYVRCRLVRTCLQEMLAWSNANPNHLPLFVQFEIKETEPSVEANVDMGRLYNLFDLVTPEPVTADSMRELDRDIQSVIPRSKMLTPDDVRGSYATLRQAVLANNWPRLASARGKFIFILDASDAIAQLYARDPVTFRGRPAFPYAHPGDDYAAFIILNDPIESDIVSLVGRGFMIRTRADADMVEIIRNDRRRADLTLRSGAQLISTDAELPIPEYGTPYQFRIPDGNPGRCNPINGAHCTASLIAE